VTDERTSNAAADSAKPRTLLLRDIVDGQLRTREGRRIGRVADVEIEWTPRGVFMRRLVLGPEAHLGRIWSRLGSFAARIWHGRHEYAIDASAVEEIGPNVMLRDTADAYDTGNADDVIRRRIFRFIPGGTK
jgi:sporulation protein YlmC with PRC-barrel domain